MIVCIYDTLNIFLQESSYQAVLITNGTSSYVIYSYEDGGMNWNRRLRRKCAVGYATKDKKYSFEDEDSFGENIFQIDSKNSMSTELKLVGNSANL